MRNGWRSVIKSVWFAKRPKNAVSVKVIGQQPRQSLFVLEACLVIDVRRTSHARNGTLRMHDFMKRPRFLTNLIYQLCLI